MDLLIKHGMTVEHKPLDIAIRDGKILAVGQHLSHKAKEILDLKGRYHISAGWIDAHVHCDKTMDLYADDPDDIGIKTGVTTLIDAGSRGVSRIEDFYEGVKSAKTQVFALLNIAQQGIVTQDELADLRNIHIEAAVEMLKKYPQFIVGLKARMSKTVIGESGIKPLELAKAIQGQSRDVPLMVHIGSAPPRIEEVMGRLDHRDVVTHCFNGKDNGILDQVVKRIKPCAIKARSKGVLFDLGHGSESFNFKTAEQAFAEGIKADIISTDVYHRNRIEGPVYNMATTLEKMQAVGYTLSEVIDRVTLHPALAFRLMGKGQLAIGYDADVTIFKVATGRKVLIDSQGDQRVTKTLIQPRYAVVKGKVHECELL